MVTASKTENETNTAVAETAAVVVAPAPSPVDISTVPESPAELLKQWDAPAPRRPLIHTIISATLVRIWDTITGPGKTEQERTDRKIFEHSRYLRAQGPYF